MRVRPSLLLVATALSAFFVAQTALGSPPQHALMPVATYQPTVAETPVEAPKLHGPKPFRLARVQGQISFSDAPGGPAAGSLASTTEFGSPQVVGVAARRGDWLGVVSSSRPNGRLAWVKRGAALELGRTRWSLRADLSERRLTLRRNGRAVHRMTVAIGRPGSETPTGRFAITDKLDGSRYGPYYGCCVLALSGHQPNTPPGWTGGNRLAIHGTDSPSSIGTAASAGCLRGADGDLRVLMAKVPLGTPVFIHP